MPEAKAYGRDREDQKGASVITMALRLWTIRVNEF